MSEAITYLKHVVEGRPDHAGFHWDHIMAALLEVEAERTPEAEEILVALARFRGPLELSDRSANLPHAMSPVDVLRSHAVQTLAAWDAGAFKDHIEHVSRTGESSNLRDIAASCLDDGEAD